MTLDDAIATLYGREINCGCETFWDGGMTVWIGDIMNGHHAETMFTQQNMSMARFAEMLQGLAPGYIHSPVLDSTGLDATFDFTLSFSMAGQLQSGPGRRGGEAPTQASDPNGALSLLDALPKQLGLKLELTKRPVEVMVIDHVEQKPTDN